MRKFRYEKGHLSAVTMTVEELILKLAQYPHDMPVFGVWEGVWGEVRQNGFTVERNMGFHPDDAIDCLLVDVDQRYDHDEFESPATLHSKTEGR